MKTIDFSYFIERYIAGEMSEAENHWFLKELENNEKLRNEVHLRKHTEKVLKNQDLISLRNKLSEIEKRREMNTPVKKSKKRVYMNFAALIALLLLIGSITLIPDRKLTANEIVDKYYKEYEPSTVPRSGTAAINEDFSLAMEFYNTHDYKNAAIHFNKVLKSDLNYMQSVLLTGVSRMEDQKYQEAEISFEEVIKDKENYFIEDAMYFLGLCYLQTDEKEKAIQQFEIINKEGSIHKGVAKKIIKELK